MTYCSSQHVHDCTVFIFIEINQFSALKHIIHVVYHLLYVVPLLSTDMYGQVGADENPKINPLYTWLYFEALALKTFNDC